MSSKTRETLLCLTTTFAKSKAAQIALLTVFVCSLPTLSRAQEFEGVPAGTDYLATQAGTSFTLPGVGTFSLVGVPDPKHPDADTIVQRLNDAIVPDRIGATATVKTQMLELQLETAPGGGPGGTTMLINLTPGVASTGDIVFTQTIDGEGPIEGTFTSFFDLFFTLSFDGLNGGPIPCPLPTCNMEAQLNGSGNWTDDNGAYFIVGPVAFSGPNENVVVTQVTPEPSALLLFGTALAGLVGVGGRKLFG